MADQASFAEDVKPLLSDLKRICWRFEKTPQAVDDLMQDVLYKAFKSYYQFEPGTNLIGWLGRIAYTTYVNKYRKKKRRPDEVDLGDTPDLYVFQSVGAEETGKAGRSAEVEALKSSGGADIEDILRAVKAAHTNHQVIMVLVDVEGHSYKEAADILDRPIGSIMSGLSRGRLAVRQELRKTLKKVA